ncbi:MAG: CBS domain-containing protein [Chloroflexota bacterium]
MLSELRQFKVRDRRSPPGRLIDLAVDLAAGDYPVVTRLVFRSHRGQPVELPWADVHSIDRRKHLLTVGDVTAARAAPPEALRRTVLLRRDILDALVLDVARRQTMRANDLWLTEREGQFWLRAADVSPWAVLRRLGRGLFGRGAEKRLVDWRDIEFLRGDPHLAEAGGDYHRRIARLPPAAIAQLSEAIPYRHAAELLTLLPEDRAADTLEVLASARQVQVFTTLDERLATRLLSLMAPDTAADLVGKLAPADAQAVLDRLPSLAAERILDLLRYPENTAGGLMTNDIPSVASDLTIDEARQVLPDQLRTPDFPYYVYVVDRSTRMLRGVISLRDVVVHPPATRIADVMVPDMVVLDPLDSAQSAARRVVEEHMAALPVVARDGRLLGAVTFDAALAQVAPLAWRDHAPRIFS